MKKNCTCFLCKNSKIKPSFKKLGYKFTKCLKCGLYWIDFNFSYNQFLNNFYQEGYFKGDKNFRAYADYGDDKKIILKNMRHYLKKIHHFKKQGNLLDIGCAFGYFLEISQSNGFNAFGIDVSKYAVEIANQKALGKIKLGTVGQVNFKHNFFNVITMFDIVEHLKSPKRDLKIIRKLLCPEGLLVIQTGDSESLWTKIFKKRWHFFAPPQHIFFFNKKNIAELLKQTGFKVVKIEKDGKWVSLRYLLHMMGYSLNSSIWDKLYNRVSKNFLGKIPLYFRFNDNMIVYAKKSL